MLQLILNIDNCYNLGVWNIYKIIFDNYEYVECRMFKQKIFEKNIFYSFQLIIIKLL